MSETSGSPRVVCIRHIAELYLVEYYERPGAYEVSQEDLLTPIITRALEQEKTGGMVGAMQNWERAEKLNPARCDIRLHLISCAYHLKDLDRVAAETKALYPYVCTRAELAAYYRWRGLWCLEKYQPALARALYRYSTYFQESREAENEIRFLDTAMKRTGAEPSREEVMDALKKAGVPLTAASVTMALLVRASQEAEGAGNLTQALDCLGMVYDLSQDAGIAEKIRELKQRTSERN